MHVFVGLIMCVCTKKNSDLIYIKYVAMDVFCKINSASTVEKSAV